MTQLFSACLFPKTTYKPLSIAVATLLLAACSSAPTTNINQPASTRTVARPSTPHSTATVQANAGLLDEDSLDELEGLLEATDMTMVENNSLLVQQYGNLWDRLRKGFKMNSNQYDPRIEAQKSWFVSRQDYLNRLTARASRYLYHTVREAERRNIPTELALLPVIESSYDPLANSNAAAVGLWQFIPSTGRIYGLNQSTTFDGRRDVIESTRAAYDFLTALYNQFGSWELALAAYNSGPGRVQSAIAYNEARGLPIDYWSLRLPTETMNYVPRFLAVAQIVKNPSNYGVYLPAIANRQHFRSVPANVGVSLYDVSRLTGVDYEELRALNPGLLASAVDMSGPNRILIPNEVASSMDKKITALKGNGYSNYPTTYNATNYPTPTVNYNQPSGGDTLAAAQQAFGKTNTALPKSGDDLANLANSMVKNQTTAYVAPAKISVTTTSEPPLSAAEQKQIAAQMAQENTLPTTSAQITANNTVIQEPPLSPTEKTIIAQQIEATSPQVAQVVNPADGNIKLNAIQTQQSILDAKGETKQLNYNGGVVSDGGMGVPAIPKTSSTLSTPPVVPTTNITTPTKVKKPRPTGERTTYQVKRGDTLNSIATQMGVNWRDIAEWNQIDPNKGLLAGASLYLYNAKPITPVAPKKPISKADEDDDTPDTYVVKSGDTLLGIANKYDLSLSELASYNNLPTNYQVRTKQTLWLIPNKVKSASIKSVEKPKVITPRYPTITYKVQSGDGLIALADDYDISVSELAGINGLSPTDDLLVGQTIRVPAPKVAKPVATAPRATIKPPAKVTAKTTTPAPKIEAKADVKKTEVAKKDSKRVETKSAMVKPVTTKTVPVTTKVAAVKTLPTKAVPTKTTPIKVTTKVETKTKTATTKKSPK